MKTSAATRTARPQSGVASPCINICQVNTANGFCEGCFRTLEEIACWSIYEDDEKLAVLAQLTDRRALI